MEGAPRGSTGAGAAAVGGPLRGRYPPEIGTASTVVAAPELARPRTSGKFLFAGEKTKLWVRGVTYGAFRPDDAGNEYGEHPVIERDFARMAVNGINVVRIPHTTPPRSLLDLALRHGLRVMVGLSAEQYVGYLIDEEGAPDHVAIARAKVRACRGHPALLCYALGNEIPAPIVRWLGPRRVTRYLERLCRAVKAEDPTGLVTYVNYPTTEYLDLPFLDLVCFNVYLESRAEFGAYLARLQNVAGNRPLLMTEVGLDSLRNGPEAQAQVLDWQIRTAFAAGCAGAIVFSWTDDWFRAGAPVEDWAFGITDRHRRAKPALDVVRRAFSEAPFPPTGRWPRVSVVVCTHNGARTLHECLNGLMDLAYPDFEVIVVNDSSTDGAADIAAGYPVRLLAAEGRGLSAARNTGLAAATGEIVAYIDDDAWPDPDWLTYLADAFTTSEHVAIGGPNLAPAGAGLMAAAVARTPGGPTPVLLSDREAEHIAGCNMAFRRESLRVIGGFDPRFRIAGDDVDVCWRLQERGWTIGYSPPAVVWHRRRGSVRAFWRQQANYGRAEALLERKWPGKFNELGHLTWCGRIYGAGPALPLARPGRVYHGVWGSAPFQRLYGAGAEPGWALLLAPEWYLAVPALAVLACLAPLWWPMTLAVPLLAAVVAAAATQAAVAAAGALRAEPEHPPLPRPRLLGLTAVLHVLQPLARLTGRIGGGLTPWRRRSAGGRSAWPRRWSTAIWTDRWAPPESHLRFLEKALRADRQAVTNGGPYDRWDLTVPGGLLASARLLMAVEDHGAGTQYVRVRLWPHYHGLGIAAASLPAGLAVLAAADRAWLAALLLGVVAVLVGARMANDAAGAMAALSRTVERLRAELTGGGGG